MAIDLVLFATTRRGFDECISRRRLAGYLSADDMKREIELADKLFHGAIVHVNG